MAKWSTLHHWLTYPSTIVAIGLIIVGILFVFAEVQSPSKLYWTGQSVEGTVSGGIIFYKVQGEEYTLDDTLSAAADGARITVYVDRDDPGNALIQRPTRWVDAGSVLVWFVAAAACLAIAPLRRRRKRRSHPVGAHPSWSQ